MDTELAAVLKDINDKLDKLMGTTVELTSAVVAANTESTTSVIDTKVMAYDRPVITDPAQVVVDEKTINKDGSVWGLSTAFSPGGGVGAQHPAQLRFGYISPRKTPEIWSFLAKHMLMEDFHAWNAEWRAHPYRLYAPDIRDMIARGSMNMILFHTIMQPVGEFVQD